MKRAALASLFLLACSVSAQAISTGPEVGARIPDLDALDQHGRQRSFEDLRGPEGLLLLFHRTADW